jgi:transketolase
MVKGDAKPILNIRELAKIEQLISLVEEARKNLLEMHQHDKHIHIDSSLTSLEVIATLQLLKRASVNPVDRDWLILSKGHAAPALYAVLAGLGIIPKAELARINSIDSVLQNHPEVGAPGVDVATGSLAQGLSIGIGIATWIKSVGGSGKVFVVMGDGELDEGQVWEAITHAAALKLDNLVVVVDWNGYQHDGSVKEVKPKDFMPLVWRAIGWKVLWANGHDVVSLMIALESALNSESPVVIFAETEKKREVPGDANHYAE